MENRVHSPKKVNRNGSLKILFRRLAAGAVFPVVSLGIFPGVRAAEALPSRPNILWISSEDHGPHIHGSWRASFRFSECIGTMNRANW